MPATVTRWYDRLILRHPLAVLLVIGLLTAFFGYHSSDFRLDASADTLTLENDQAVEYYRSIRARYGTDDFLIVTYTPAGELFSAAVLTDLRRLRDRLAAIDRVDSVISILDVPLISSPPVTLNELSRSRRTLETPGMDLDMARSELIHSPLYRNLLISTDGRTTALQVVFKRDVAWHQLLERRDRLREKRLNGELSAQEAADLDSLSAEFNAYSAALLDQQHEDIASVRRILDEHRDGARLYLGGVPMIVADSIDFIRHDLLTFGAGVLCFLIVILAVAFHRPRWILLPMLTCFGAGVIMIGLLGLLDWPVTVVSSNFVSLMLIITLSLTIHLIVRYRELHEENPAGDQYHLVRETIHTKGLPSFYTAITTMVAFSSLLFSGIRPVIDFGWMMTIGTAVAFLLAFSLFPAALLLMKPGTPPKLRSLTAVITRSAAHLNVHHGAALGVVYILVVVASILGMTMLTVENRFIDYFKESTEIYRGMKLIDREMGGTTPLDVIVDAPAEFLATAETEQLTEQQVDAEEAVFMDDSDLEAPGSAGITGTSYWFNTYRLETVAAIHDYLDGLRETGKVLSITTTMRMLESLKDSSALDDFFLAILYKRLPDDIRETLFTPYMAEDGNQLRFAIRVFESDPSLKREQLLEKIRRHLAGTMGLEAEQVHLTGMLVLYNNMLQSLFRSQILTLGIVFLAILVMFIILFRNLKMASVAIIPTLLAALQVLGLMGWLGIPLDLMTITIAAIVIGIAVDDAIHYVHRFTVEFGKDGNYRATMERCHDSIGRAMYYTTITVTLGFMILVLSNFIPTIYFGLLTGFAMLVALIANLTLLPLLIIWIRPLGEQRQG
ncbi:MAG: MMPL family transporter [Gammaproteobacteria bacterium]|jgi:hypothetical protein